MATGKDYINLISIRGQLELEGKTPKDHKKSNKDYIKHKQEVVQKKIEDDSKPKSKNIIFIMYQMTYLS